MNLGAASAEGHMTSYGYKLTDAKNKSKESVCMKNNVKKTMGNFVIDNLSWFILIFVCIIFSVFNKNFFSVNNLLNILAQYSYVIVAALGVSLLMMSGGMDLSIGYIMSISGVICALLMIKLNVHPAIAVIICIASSIIMCCCNMFLSQVLKLPIFIVSLGTMNIYQGLSYVISNSKSITGFSGAYKFIGQGRIGAIPFVIIIAGVLFVIMNFVMEKTYFGRYVFAIGGNEKVAYLTGIKVKTIRYTIAILAGFFIGLAAVMLTSRMGSAQSSFGPGTEFSIIVGVLLGGVSINGGSGKLSGILGGILIVSVLTNGMQLVGLNIYYQYIAKGAIMLAAISFDIYQRKKRVAANLNRLIAK